MSRVTPADVKAIVSTALLDPVLQTWIDAANTIVNSIVSCVAGDEVLLTQIELYLSAHLISQTETGGGNVSKEKAEDLETTYNVASIKNNINDTVFGKTANMLATGCLTNTNNSTATVEFF